MGSIGYSDEEYQGLFAGAIRHSERPAGVRTVSLSHTEILRRWVQRSLRSLRMTGDGEFLRVGISPGRDMGSQGDNGGRISAHVY